MTQMEDLMLAVPVGAPDHAWGPADAPSWRGHG